MVTSELATLLLLRVVKRTAAVTRTQTPHVVRTPTPSADHFKVDDAVSGARSCISTFANSLNSELSILRMSIDSLLTCSPLNFTHWPCSSRASSCRQRNQESKQKVEQCRSVLHGQDTKGTRKQWVTVHILKR
eukprot:1133377-Rhodomonas_salina.4